jgi:FkbM family methyltransferase
MSNLLNIHPDGVLHVGAHTAEEWADYQKFDWSPIIWVEAQPELAQELQSRLPQESNIVYTGVVWSESGIPMELKITNSKGSTSLLDFNTHLVEHPDIVVESKLSVITTTLDELIPPTTKFQLIVIDIQGAELEALNGFKDRLGDVRWIYCEVNKKELYKNCPKVDAIDLFLERFGFERNLTRWTIHGWGDALYINKKYKGERQTIGQVSGLLKMRVVWFLNNLRHRLSLIVRVK